MNSLIASTGNLPGGLKRPSPPRSRARDEGRYRSQHPPEQPSSGLVFDRRHWPSFRAALTARQRRPARQTRTSLYARCWCPGAVQPSLCAPRDRDRLGRLAGLLATRMRPAVHGQDGNRDSYTAAAMAERILGRQTGSVVVAADGRRYRASRGLPAASLRPVRATRLG